MWTMGRAQRHAPRCIDCGAIFPHNLTVCIKIRSGKKIHRCISCDEKRRAERAKEWSGAAEAGNH